MGRRRVFSARVQQQMAMCVVQQVLNDKLGQVFKHQFQQHHFVQRHHINGQIKPRHSNAHQVPITLTVPSGAIHQFLAAQHCFLLNATDRQFRLQLQPSLTMSFVRCVGHWCTFLRRSSGLHQQRQCRGGQW